MHSCKRGLSKYSMIVASEVRTGLSNVVEAVAGSGRMGCTVSSLFWNFKAQMEVKEEFWIPRPSQRYGIDRDL